MKDWVVWLAAAVAILCVVTFGAVVARPGVASVDIRETGTVETQQWRGIDDWPSEVWPDRDQ